MSSKNNSPLLPPSADLPPEQQRLLHADFLANEQAYLSLRDSLLPQYRGQWVAVHDGRVVASGEDLLKIMDEAAATGGHPYIVKVGEEDEFAFRVRRVDFPYDQTYRPFALPRLDATYSTSTVLSSMDPPGWSSSSRDREDTL